MISSQHSTVIALTDPNLHPGPAGDSELAVASGDITAPEHPGHEAVAPPPTGSGAHFQLIFYLLNPIRFLRHSLRVRLFLGCADLSTQCNHVPDYIDVYVACRRIGSADKLGYDLCVE